MELFTFLCARRTGGEERLQCFFTLSLFLFFDYFALSFVNVCVEQSITTHRRGGGGVSGVRVNRCLRSPRDLSTIMGGRPVFNPDPLILRYT